MVEQLEPVMVPLENLKPNAYNPNEFPEPLFERFCEFVAKFGFMSVVLALPDGTIIDGEHRWRAAKRLGLKEVPVHYIDEEDAEAKMDTIAFNRFRGDFDMFKLADVFERLRQEGWSDDQMAQTFGMEKRKLTALRALSSMPFDERQGDAFARKAQADMEAALGQLRDMKHVYFRCMMPKEAAENVKAEIARLTEHISTSGYSTSERIGRALLLMARLSRKTPKESLE